MRIPGAIRSIYWQRRLAQCRVRPWAQLPITDCGPRPSVAIVGNAGYLTELDQDERIDAHDIVVRMNNFAVAGFERAVGVRTHLLVTSFVREIRFRNHRAPTPQWVAASVPPNFHKDQARGLLFRHGINIARGMTLMRRREVFVPSIDDYTALCRKLGAMPTTGAMAILLITDVLADQVGDVFITGFSFFEGRSHYHDSRNVDPVMHAMEAEKAMLTNHLRPLIAAGRVTLDPLLARDHFPDAAEPRRG